MLDTIPLEVFERIIGALHQNLWGDPSFRHTAAILCRTSKVLYDRTAALLYRSLSYGDAYRPELVALLASKPALGHHVRELGIGIEALSLPTGWSMETVEVERRQLLANCLGVAAYCPQVTDLSLQVRSGPDIFNEGLDDEEKHVNEWTVHVCCLSCPFMTAINDLASLDATGLAAN